MTAKLLLPGLSLLFCCGLAGAQSLPPACSVSASSCTDFLVSWTAIDGAIGFDVFRDGSQIPVASLPGTATSYLDHPPADASHTYCVRLQGSGASPCCTTARFEGPSPSVAPSDWFQDAFPSNETISTSTFGAWDTTSAWIRTGRNMAPLTGDDSRLDLPGDTLVCNAPGAGLRLDLVFRILPGAGNYVQAGNRATGLRRVPTSPTTAVANAASANFWESYLADNGAVGTAGDGTSGPGHPLGWDPHRWNSARCDTAETNLFPVEGRLANLPALTPGRWASMYHESDPKYSTLGVPKNRCFLVDPAGALNSSNITCGAGTYPPAWSSDAATGRAPSEGGLPAGVTREFTQIIPDGQLTPGASVQYFLRLSSESSPATPLAMNPDTQLVYPQPDCGQVAERWAQFGVLPDRWKDPAFGTGGSGMAGLLVIDADDRGDEVTFISIADTIRLNLKPKLGAHNGWLGVAPGADLNDPASFVRANGGQAGTYFDLYRVRGGRDTLTGNAGSLGGRLAPRCVGCPASGRESRQAPTSAMLRNYRDVWLLTGNRNVAIMGPAIDRGQDDWASLADFLVLPGGSFPPRGVWVTGSGFGESESGLHAPQLSTYFRASLRSGDYAALSGNSSPNVSLSVPNPMPAKTYRLQSSSMDVFNLNVASPPGVASSYYENVGGVGPYVATVHGPQSGGSRPFVTVLDGFDLRDMGSMGGPVGTYGRQDYVCGVFGFQLGAVGVFQCGAYSIGVEPNELSTAFLSLAGNPVTRGAVTIGLTLERTELVKLAVYDLGGRRLRTLADGVLAEGPHVFSWRLEGVSPGMYWVRASTASGKRAARALVVLR